ncbi:unnamed protein product [Linum tenue]|uniref:uroporphyrinogen decarboxylase n=1 Tax=Linum tenue TaxID=586396 RepID=A0AAV0J562_9ROSI|nr:unnamed protein product [Linum tenue]
MPAIGCGGGLGGAVSSISPSFSALSSAFPPTRISASPKPPYVVRCALQGTVAEPQAVSTTKPLLLNAVRGQDVERPPVWLMRQAGRYMKSYQMICEKHPSIRERSENVDLVMEISLHPWKVFKPDGVILFSDILTPLSGMNIPFDIVKGKGHVIFNPLRTSADVDLVREFVPDESVPYVGEALTILRKEVDNQAAVLGFVGAPFTLASYIVEGSSSKHFSKIKRLAFSQPKVLHALLQKFATSMAKYIQYQADKGAQVVQIFDSWATELSPVDFEEFSLPYLKQIVDTVKQTHPPIPSSNPLCKWIWRLAREAGFDRSGCGQLGLNNGHGRRQATIGTRCSSPRKCRSRCSFWLKRVHHQPDQRCSEEGW